MASFIHGFGVHCRGFFLVVRSGFFTSTRMSIRLVCASVPESFGFSLLVLNLFGAKFLGIIMFQSGYYFCYSASSSHNFSLRSVWRN